ncbi:MAG TPA: hypothetical protein VHK22_04695 [Gaiellaceae bacterium]|jgi:hypothetical protein|nr:hypothetical protein [Gaiellaceae bacterium]
MAAPLAGSDLDAYRDEADGFIAALDEEFYRHFAGHKETLDVAPIYERYADLTTLERAERLAASAAERPELTELWRFACEGYLGALTREQAERLANLEASLTAEVDGETIGFRALRPALANEPERERRARLEAARVELTEEHLLPLYVDAAEERREATTRLGAETYRGLYERFRFPLARMEEQCRTLLDATEDEYVDTLDEIFRARVGVGLEDAKRYDVARVFRATEWDEGFPADAMLPALEATLSDLGIDLRRQANVELDVEQRPQKSPRAFCAPIEVPGRVVLVIQPMGGADDWRALFHEAGHTEHFAHIRASLPVEHRRLGDPTVSEGWAALLERLVDDPAWLSRRLDFGRPQEFAAEGAALHLYLARRYAAKLLYELELHTAEELLPLRERYVEILRDATKIEPSGADFLADVDEGFYAIGYLRSWAFEAQLRTHLRREFGTTWFARREAGSLLRELWNEGQSMNGDEILQEVAGVELDLAAVAERIEEPLRA